MTTPGRTNKSGDGGAANQYVVPGADVSGRYGAPTNLYGNVPRYADPAAGAPDGYHDSPVTAWAPSFRVTPDGMPDARRLGQIPIYEYRPPSNRPPQEWWLDPSNGPGYEEQARHNASEFIDADGMALSRPVGEPGKRAAPDPRRTPPPESRTTQQLSPHRYVFTRKFDQHAARQFDGSHFSMADHRRNYPIMGMAPIGYKRNTYRADPTPWDTNQVDYPAAQDQYRGAGGFISADVPWNSSRSGRLD